MRFIRILLPFSILLLCNFYGCPKDGDPGDTGKRGPSGLQGLPGTIGPRGPAGEAGLGALHAVDNEGTDMGYVLDVEGNNVKVWKSDIGEVRIYDRISASVVEPSYENIKVYFPTNDCSGPPYTYVALTLPNTIYKTDYDGGKHLKTGSTQTNLFIPTVVHAGSSNCVSENATYDLYQAEWWTLEPEPAYVAPISIEAR